MSALTPRRPAAPGGEDAPEPPGVGDQHHAILAARDRLAAAEAALATAAGELLASIAHEASYLDGATAVMLTFPEWTGEPLLLLVGGGPPRPMYQGAIANVFVADELGIGIDGMLELAQRAVAHLPRQRQVFKGAGW